MIKRVGSLYSKSRVGSSTSAQGGMHIYLTGAEKTSGLRLGNSCLNIEGFQLP